MTMDQEWLPDVLTLCASIRAQVREALGAVADGAGRRDDVARVVGRGAGDTTFAIDEVAERAVEEWMRAAAARRPVSVLTEDAGWRHFGPGSDGAVTGLDGFDHGGPRIVLDPIDGTRNLMHDLRSAWVVVSFAGPGAGEPRFTDLQLGVVSEIPDTRGRVARELVGRRGAGATVRTIEATNDSTLDERDLTCDDELRLDHGYFPFFGYHPASRPRVQALAADVVRRVGASHEIDASTVFDDQYISSGGQLALLALGHYRSIVDARRAVGERTGVPTQTAKPYDMAGAALVAREAGCVVTRPDGAPLDFPLDASTPIDFAGFHNRATADALLPHLIAAVRAL